MNMTVEELILLINGELLNKTADCPEKLKAGAGQI
jgi:hypothetical protein